jgi:hypothetical protein
MARAQIMTLYFGAILSHVSSNPINDLIEREPRFEPDQLANPREVRYAAMYALETRVVSVCERD